MSRLWRFFLIVSKSKAGRFDLDPSASDAQARLRLPRFFLILAKSRLSFG